MELSKGELSPGMMGMSISVIISLTDIMVWGARQMGDLETEVVALERVDEYMKVESEAEWTKAGNCEPNDWPTLGRIEFKNYSTRYRSELPLVLKNLNFEIVGGSKIGVVGRTGSGKSTLTLALFRLLEPAVGTILIDSVDVCKLGLHDLRRRITIIPQDPSLFSGTLRRNLDPFDHYQDESLWSALDLCHLKQYVLMLPSGLQSEIDEGGTNLSAGQRQLVCLARAILRRTKILVLDEATASVDMETDAWIQETVRTQFTGCTVITIAHRLATILDYDMVLVMSNGRVSEYGRVQDLINDSASEFCKMASEAGVIDDK